MPDSMHGLPNRIFNKMESSVYGASDLKKTMKKATEGTNKAKDKSIQNDSSVKTKSNIEKTKELGIKGGKVLLSFNVILQGALFSRGAITRIVNSYESRTPQNPKATENLDKAATMEAADAYKNSVMNCEIQLETAPPPPKEATLPTKTETPPSQVNATVNSNLTPEETKMAKASVHIRKEIIHTEVSYIENLDRAIAGIDNLIAMRDAHVISLPANSINLEQAKADFKAARDSSMQLVAKLYEANQQYDESDPATSFAANKEFAKVFSENMSSYAEKTLPLTYHNGALTALHGDLKAALESPKNQALFLKYKDEATKGTFHPENLSAHLSQSADGFIAPVQRLPRFDLFGKELVKNSNEPKEMQEAHDEIVRNAKMVNSKGATFDALQKLQSSVEDIIQSATPRRQNLFITRSPDTENATQKIDTFLSNIESLANSNIDENDLKKLSGMLDQLKRSPAITKLLKENSDLENKLNQLESSINNNLTN